MPQEYSQLRGKPEPLLSCPKCLCKPFSSGQLRGLVQVDWRRRIGLPYCCVICDRCHEIVGHERPPINVRTA
jgi:hypothetical protein